MVIRLGPGKKRPVQVGRNFVWSAEEQARFDASLRNVPKRKHEFVVLEAGCGTFPHALVEKVLRAQSAKHLKHRRFIAVDKEAIDLNALLSRRGKVKAGLLEVKQADIIHLVEKLKPNSQHVIFGSFLINNLGSGRPTMERVKIQKEFLRKCKKALSPGGRLVFISNKFDLHNYQLFAEKLGLKLHSIEISDEDAAQSKHEAVRDRSTPALRLKQYEYSMSHGCAAYNEISMLITKGMIKDNLDMFTPTIFVFRKPRPYYVGSRGASSTSKSLVKAGNA